MELDAILILYPQLTGGEASGQNSILKGETLTMLLSIVLAIVVIAMGVWAANLLDEEMGAMPFIAGGAVFMVSGA